jgi:hypothetical protein
VAYDVEERLDFQLGLAEKDIDRSFHGVLCGSKHGGKAGQDDGHGSKGGAVFYHVVLEALDSDGPDLLRGTFRLQRW